MTEAPKTELTEEEKAAKAAKKAATAAKRTATSAATKQKREEDGYNNMTTEEKADYRAQIKKSKEVANKAMKLVKEEEKAAKKAVTAATNKAAKEAAKLAKEEEKAAKKAAQPIVFHPVAAATAPVSDTIWKDIVSKIALPFKNRLMRHHELYSLPVKGEYFEESLSRSLAEAGYKTDWEPNFSHEVGKDMGIKELSQGRISCKSGTKDAKNVKISGSRSESYKTIEEKVNHFSADHDDVCFMLSKNKPFNKVYTLLVYRSSVFKPNLLTWREHEKGNQWFGEGDFSATIGKSMSSQLWTTLPLGMAEVTFVFDCN